MHCRGRHSRAGLAQGTRSGDHPHACGCDLGTNYHPCSPSRPVPCWQVAIAVASTSMVAPARRVRWLRPTRSPEASPCHFFRNGSFDSMGARGMSGDGNAVTSWFGVGGCDMAVRQHCGGTDQRRDHRRISAQLLATPRRGAVAGRRFSLRRRCRHRQHQGARSVNAGHPRCVRRGSAIRPA